MTTTTLTIEPGDTLSADHPAVRACAEQLDRGGLVVLPTNTNYNMACDSTNADAVARVFAAKQRTKLGPLPLIMKSVDDVVRYVQVPPWLSTDVLRAIWPSELHFIFRQRYDFPRQLTCGLGTVAASLNPHPVLSAVAGAASHPLACTSANRSGFVTNTVTLALAQEQLGDLVDLYLDAGPTPAQLSDDAKPIVNTIVDLTFDPPMLCREGWFETDRVRQIIPNLVVDPGRYQSLIAARAAAS